MARSIIFAGCMKNAAPFLKMVLANCERLAATAESAFFIFAENDSTDATKTLLTDWCADRENVQVLCFDGLDSTMSQRTQRLAFLRNHILTFIKEQGLSSYDALCIMDFDEVNMGEIDPSGFITATEFLFSAPENAAVFAVSDPVYYDIYALRHAEWCPRDCWKEIRQTPAAGRTEAFQRLVCDRQVPIDENHPPIPVISAFGGLGLYKMSFALRGTYVGSDHDGEEVCEHVAFNEDINNAGGRLYVFPALRNRTPWEHCLQNRLQKTMRLSNGTHEFALLAPQSHQLDHYLQVHPLYDRRLPLLLTTFNEIVGEASVLDIGANILNTVTLMRLSGVRLSKSISVDASLEFYKYATFNAEKNAPHFDKSEILWAFVGAAADRGNIVAENGTGSIRHVRRSDSQQDLLSPRQVTFSDLAPTGVDLVKTDLDGYDQVVIQQNMDWLLHHKPMLWAEAQIEEMQDISVWSSVFLGLADEFPFVAAFDNFGFCLCAGSMIEKWNVVLELIAIGARYKANEAHLGTPRFYYLDLLFCPRHRETVFHEFIGRLPEMTTARRTRVKAPNEPLPQTEYHARVG